MSGEFTFSDCKCGARDERILIERCTATWRILGDVYVVYCTECGEAESFVSLDRNDASALNGCAIRAWNTRHGAGDAEDAARWRFFAAAFDRPMEREWLRKGFGLHPDDFTPSITAVVDAARAGERG